MSKKKGPESLAAMLGASARNSRALVDVLDGAGPCVGATALRHAMDAAKSHGATSHARHLDVGFRLEK